jgi:uncharacterized membrane protein YeaQ/YmgE (transglycosylase-associated protein family)
MGELLIWAVFGLIVGVGGYLGRVMGLYGPGQYGGFFMSILGALVLLFLYRQFSRTRA